MSSKFQFLYSLLFINFLPVISEKQYRLPTAVKPLHYKLTLQPDFISGVFYGSVNITLNIVQNTSLIVLHQQNLTIDYKSVKLHDINHMQNISLIRIRENKDDTHFFQIQVDRELVENYNYILEFRNFTGVFTYNDDGFYLGKYKNENGSDELFATTQFESTFARKAFPCFDEPALKATFQINIIRPKKYNSISNENILRTELLRFTFETWSNNIDFRIVNDNFEKDVFKTSINMSSYLVAFVVSTFRSVKLDGNIDFRIFAEPSKTNENLKWALNHSSAVINCLTNVLNISYKMSKLDQVGIPKDYYEFAAMENWGLITYSETYLLSDQSSTSDTNQTIAMTIAHEFAHQWFGNLVTADWWKYLWLNEGFATYFEVYVTDSIYPEWKLWEQFVVKYVQGALHEDSLETRCLNQDVASPQEIADLFDEITYDKSASILRMAQTFLTIKIFLEGLRIYLDNWQYMSVVPKYLYSALQDSYNNNPTLQILLPKYKTIRDVLSTWDSQPGYPLITVTHEKSKITLKQERFLLSNRQSTYTKQQKWFVPITWALNANDFQNTSTKCWLTDSVMEVNLNVSFDWIVLNVQARGFYRVNYDPSNWQFLIKLLNSDNFTQIPETNRAQIIDDSFNLARAGILKYETALSLSNYIARETNYVPLYAFFKHVEYLENILYESPFYERFQKYIFELTKTAYNKIGTIDEGSHVNKLNRELIIHWMCILGFNKCREEALRRLHVWKENKNQPIASNLKSLLCGAVIEGTSEDWHYLWMKYNETKNIHILTPLSCTTNKKLLQWYLEQLLSSNFSISNTDRGEAIMAVFETSFGLKFGLQYFYNNYEQIKKSMDVESYLMFFTDKIISKSNYNLLLKLWTKYKPTTLKNEIVKIHKIVEQSNQNYKEVSQWLVANHATFCSLSVKLYIAVFTIQLIL